MEVITELGVDINSNWNFINGDLELIYYDENLVQACRNRLNTALNDLDLFYENYGSNIKGFFGWRADEETKDFIEIEITETLQQDPRLKDFDIEVNFKDGKISADVYCVFDEDTDLSFNLVISEDDEVE